MSNLKILHSTTPQPRDEGVIYYRLNVINMWDFGKEAVAFDGNYIGFTLDEYLTKDQFSSERKGNVSLDLLTNEMKQRINQMGYTVAK